MLTKGKNDDKNIQKGLKIIAPEVELLLDSKVWSLVKFLETSV